MEFSENQDHDITLAEAAQMTLQHRTQNPTLPLGGLFGKQAILDILTQPDCAGLKYYHALNNGQHTIILCGADAAGNDLHTGKLAEYCLPCPPNQGISNPLNSLI